MISFYMDVASNCYYEKARRTMNTVIVSYLLKHFDSFSAAELNNIVSQSFCSRIFNVFFLTAYSYPEQTTYCTQGYHNGQIYSGL